MNEDDNDDNLTEVQEETQKDTKIISTVVYKTWFTLVEKAAKAKGISASHYIRDAVTAQLKKDGVRVTILSHPDRGGWRGGKKAKKENED